MATIKDLVQSADWKTEKHVPVIEAPDKVKKGEAFKITASVGKEIAHPNTTEHHIRWIEVYFHPRAEKFPYQIGKFEFAAHGESAQGPNTSTVYTQPAVTVTFKTEKAGIIYATSYCNIHGIWEGAKDLNVE
ncbi:MAG TPA: class II SORL domain-containing protein [Patescibacteria group bacterium]|nr:class II SORL domain-containing protein [Patescibacteria group bacterium]